jgi:hypothetical protein
MATVLFNSPSSANEGSRLTRDLNLLVVAMLEDGCSPTNCPEMRTLDCQYLCATHDKPRECPATDYIIHTLDYTTALLNSTKLFPNRFPQRSDNSSYQDYDSRWTDAVLVLKCQTAISNIYTRLRTSQ